jgi:hypothetical protein
VVWPCKRSGEKKNPEKSIGKKLERKRPMGQPRAGWLIQVLEDINKRERSSKKSG